MEISAKTVSVEINLADANGLVVDFTKENLDVSGVTFDLDGSKGEIIQASGDLSISVAGYFMVSGEFAFEKSTHEITLSDGNKITANALTIGGADVSAFAGINGGTADEMGLKLSKVDFLLARIASVRPCI